LVDASVEVGGLASHYGRGTRWDWPSEACGTRSGKGEGPSGLLLKLFLYNAFSWKEQVAVPPPESKILKNVRISREVIESALLAVVFELLVLLDLPDLLN
jgi:hypothetical protein